MSSTSFHQMLCEIRVIRELLISPYDSDAAYEATTSAFQGIYLLQLVENAEDIPEATETMFSRLYLIPSTSRPFIHLTCASSRLSCKESVGYLKQQSLIVHYRWKSSSDSQENAITNSKENENTQITIGKKVKETAKDAGYLGIIIAGIGVTGIMFYAIFRELFSGHSPNSVYTDALKICRCDPAVVDALGEPIKGYGELSSRGRRRHVSHLEYEKDGKNYMRLKFYVKGSRNTGTVHLEMMEDENSKYMYRYLFVDIEGYPPRTLILKDNRHLDGNYTSLKELSS